MWMIHVDHSSLALSYIIEGEKTICICFPSLPSFRSVNGTKPPSERETPLEPHINLSIEHFNALRGHLLGRYWLVDRAEEELRD